jgi:hypothetical protein
MKSMLKKIAFLLEILLDRFKRKRKSIWDLD